MKEYAIGLVLIALIITVALASAKMLGIVDWSWWVVLAPAYGSSALALVLVIFAAAVIYFGPDWR